MTWSEWIRGTEIEPSIYAADFSRLGEQIDALLEGGARIFHYDVGDGHFVEPITIGPIVLKDIAPSIHAAGGRVDCHLMVDNPARHFEQIREAGADSVTFHVEVAGDPAALAAAARAAGLAVGIAFNPETAAADAARVAAAAAADVVLCMTIHPGYSGQEFLPESLDRIRELRALVPDRLVQVDGGVRLANIREVREAGVDLLVCGSAAFSTVPDAYLELAAAVAA